MPEYTRHHAPPFDAQRGAALDISEIQEPIAWQRCTVTEVHPGGKTCSVFTERGEYHSPMDFPKSYIDTSTGAGEYAIPKVGDVFALHYQLGVPALTPFPTEIRAAEGLTVPAQVTHLPNYGGQDGLHVGTLNTANIGPTDMQPGDWARVGPKGNLIALLDGGATILKASELAQIIAERGSDLLRLLGRNLEIMTGFGEVSFKNNGDATSMSLRGGANHTEQSSPALDNYTIHADLGDQGKLVDFRITDPRGNTLARVHYGPGGAVTKSTVTDSTELIGGQQSIEVVEDRDLTVLGNEIRDVKGDFTQLAGRTATIESNTDTTINAGQDIGLGSIRDINVNAGRSLNVTVSGDDQNSAGDTAMTTSVINGSYVVHIGDPGAGSSPSAQSGFEVAVKDSQGAIDLEVQSGKISLKTTTSDSVVLGGSSAEYHAMMFEKFEQFMNQFGNYIDNHQHPTGVGPTGTPIVQPFSTTKSDLPPIKSRYVTLGG